MQTIRNIAVAPMNRLAWLWLWVPLLLTLAVMLGVMLMGQQKSSAAQLAWGLPLVLVVGIALSWALRRQRIMLDNRELRIAATFYNKRLSVEAIDLGKARVIDLDEHTDLRPMVKTNGFALPGLAAGHYRLRNLSKAFCLITDRSRVLLLPLRHGGQVLLSPANPRALLEQLHQLAAVAPRR